MTEKAFSSELEPEPEPEPEPELEPEPQENEGADELLPLELLELPPE